MGKSTATAKLVEMAIRAQVLIAVRSANLRGVTNLEAAPEGVVI